MKQILSALNSAAETGSEIVVLIKALTLLSSGLSAKIHRVLDERTAPTGDTIRELLEEAMSHYATAASLGDAAMSVATTARMAISAVLPTAATEPADGLVLGDLLNAGHGSVHALAIAEQAVVQLKANAVRDIDLLLDSVLRLDLPQDIVNAVDQVIARARSSRSSR